ncbi:sigma 54-interacting transcriptional regulator [bacterium]|nr:sigma 54-interacting transcriptional regulator [bacterium]
MAKEINSKPFIANSPSMKQLIAMVDISASTTEPVLITGETGTGKELVARLIHEKSDRAGKPFVPVNCAAIPETLFEREFFGHARGAFTGADGERPGLCEAADGGTMFLDEIADMPAYLQVKLLRMLQEGTFHRLGDPTERRADLRIIAATNAPLPELIATGAFRHDLYYRLQTLEMNLPPLRERPEDLEPMIRLFVSKIVDDEVDPRELFDQDVMIVLEHYPWPGNVRELEAMTRRLALLARHSGRATLEMLPESMRKWRNMKPSATGSLHLGAYIEKVERERISQALLIKGCNRSEAARALGISRNQLYRKMGKFGIRLPV